MKIHIWYETDSIDIDFSIELQYLTLLGQKEEIFHKRFNLEKINKW